MNKKINDTFQNKRWTVKLTNFAEVIKTKFYHSNILKLFSFNDR